MTWHVNDIITPSYYVKKLNLISIYDLKKDHFDM